MKELTETPLEDVSEIIIGEWFSVREYYSSLEDDKGVVEFLSNWLIEEAEPFMRDLANNYNSVEGGYSELQKEYLRKYVYKYNQFFEHINKEEDKQYKNEQIFKALTQIPSEIEDFMKKHEKDGK